MKSYHENELPENLVNTVITDAFVVMCSDGRSLWPKTGYMIVRDGEDKLRINVPCQRCDGGGEAAFVRDCGATELDRCDVCEGTGFK